MGNVKKLEKFMKDGVTRDMIEHTDSISGHLIESWRRMTI